MGVRAEETIPGRGAAAPPKCLPACGRARQPRSRQRFRKFRRAGIRIQPRMKMTGMLRLGRGPGIDPSSLVIVPPAVATCRRISGRVRKQHHPLHHRTAAWITCELVSRLRLNRGIPKSLQMLRTGRSSISGCRGTADRWPLKRLHRHERCLPSRSSSHP